MSSRKKIALIALLALAIALTGTIAVVALVSKPVRVLAPGETLPDRDIVFLLDRGVLGFINADGSGFASRKVDLPDWRWQPFTTVPELEDYVVWGLDGEYLIGRYSVIHRGSGIPLLILADGTFVKCPDDETSPYAEGRSQAIFSKTILTVDSDVEHGPDRVVLVDMTDCEVVSTLYTAAPNEILREATISSQRWLAISRYFHQRDEVTVMKPDSSIVAAALSDAIYPAWSPDGEWLAFSIYNDGLYVVRKDGTDVCKLAAAHFSLIPSWSHDGQWLVYSRDQVIYKLDFSDRKEYELFKGGYNPNWKWEDSTR
jgi:hypothetical protein